MPFVSQYVFDLDHAISLYNSGKSCSEVAQAVGVSLGIVYDRMRKAGVTFRNGSSASRKIRPERRTQIPDLEALIKRYEAGETLQGIAESTGYHEMVLAKRFRERGIAIRSRFAYPTNTAPAHAAKRGKPNSLDAKLRAAQTRERRILHASEYEYRFAGWMREAGFEIVQQKAVGKYNIDIAVCEPPIAVEILGGGYGRAAKAARPQRTEYLINHGWHVIFISRGTIMPESVEHIVAFADLLRRDPPPPRQYRMMRTNRNDRPALCSDLHNGTIPSDA